MRRTSLRKSRPRALRLPPALAATIAAGLMAVTAAPAATAANLERAVAAWGPSPALAATLAAGLMAVTARPESSLANLARAAAARVPSPALAATRSA